MRKPLLHFFAAIIFCTLAGLAQAVSYGTYAMDNHPDGNQTPPAYGLRLDGLMGGSTVYTFDVTNQGLGNGLTLTYTASGIHISGTIWGGVDNGSSWTNPEAWTVDFTFSSVTTAIGDDDLWTHNTDTSFNSVVFGLGTLTRVGTGQVWDLRDQSNGGYSFRLGDEDNDLGHRGFDGISGWGWLDFRLHGTTTWNHVGSDDWLFTLNQVPEGTWYGAEPLIAILGFLGLAIFFRRRTGQHV